MKRLGKIPHRGGDGKETGGSRHISTRLSVCRWALLTVMAKAILIAIRIVHSFKGMVGSDGHN
jgi:hypothetical protein